MGYHTSRSRSSSFTLNGNKGMFILNSRSRRIIQISTFYLYINSIMAVLWYFIMLAGM